MGIGVIVTIIILSVMVVAAIIMIFTMRRKLKAAAKNISTEAELAEARKLKANLDGQVALLRVEYNAVLEAEKAAQGRVEQYSHRIELTKKWNEEEEKRRDALAAEVKRLEEEEKGAAQRRVEEWEAAERRRATAELGEAVAKLKEEYSSLEIGVNSKMVLLADLTKRYENLAQKGKELAEANAEALRRQAVEAGKGSSIELDEADWADVAVLRRTAHGMRCENAILKATYDFYVRPQIERVIRNEGAAGVCGIYRIYRNVDGVDISYVGQSVDIGERWKAHAKRAWGVDNTGRITLYEEMMKVGIDKWKWEILEVTDKDGEVLSEREKYWGGFYQAGLNKKLG